METVVTLPRADRRIRSPSDDVARGDPQIDRTRCELQEIASHSVRAVDKADAGLNPLGLAKDVVPFDIDPARVGARRDPLRAGLRAAPCRR